MSDAESFLQALKWGDSWADLLGITGFFLTLVGFGITLFGIWRTKKVAEQARDSIALLETIVDFQEAIQALENIRGLHRLKPSLDALADKYASTRMLLVAARNSGVAWNEDQNNQIQSVIVAISSMEKRAERAFNENQTFDWTKWNPVLSSGIDDLIGVLQHLRLQKIRRAAK